MPRRRALATLPLAALAACQQDGSGPQTGATPITGQGARTVVYLGAPDCEYCRAWYAGARSALLAAPEMQGVRLVERDLPSYRFVDAPASWPADIRWITEQLNAQGRRGRATPFYAVVEEGRILAWGTGTAAIDRHVRPALARRAASA